MTKRGFVSLFLKMVAIYFLVRSIPSLLSIADSLYSLRSFGYPESLHIVLSSIFSLFVFAALMVIVVWKSDRLSKRFVTEDEPLFGSYTLCAKCITFFLEVRILWLLLKHCPKGKL